MESCRCVLDGHEPRRIALTGGPGAGKTAVLEVARRQLCRHVVVLPESASLLFRGGFPRHDTEPGRRATQRAIYRVQCELERLELEERRAAVILCDRGTVDGGAYWPDGDGDLFTDVGSSIAAELARYDAVIHLRTPSADGGYDRHNPLRTETPEEAHRLDERILAVWSAHPNRTVIDSQTSFLDKLALAIEAIRAHVPACCRPLRHSGG